MRAFDDARNGADQDISSLNIGMRRVRGFVPQRFRYSVNMTMDQIYLAQFCRKIFARIVGMRSLSIIQCQKDRHKQNTIWCVIMSYFSWLDLTCEIYFIQKE